MTHTPAAQPSTPRKKKGLRVEKPTRFRPHLGRAVNRPYKCVGCALPESLHTPAGAKLCQQSKKKVERERS